MAPCRGMANDRRIVADRRADVMRLTRSGYSAQEIAIRLGVAQRTVVRHRSAARSGRRIGRTITAPVAARLSIVAAGIDRGARFVDIARDLGVTPRAVRYYRTLLAADGLAILGS